MTTTDLAAITTWGSSPAATRIKKMFPPSLHAPAVRQYCIGPRPSGRFVFCAETLCHDVMMRQFNKTLDKISSVEGKPGPHNRYFNVIKIAALKFVQYSTFGIQYSIFNIQHSTFKIQHSTFIKFEYCRVQHSNVR